MIPETIFEIVDTRPNKSYSRLVRSEKTPAVAFNGPVGPATDLVCDNAGSQLSSARCNLPTIEVKSQL